MKEKEKGAKMAFEVDDDLPGLGQFYCTPCGRHFFDQASLTSHADSRGHIRRYRVTFSNLVLCEKIFIVELFCCAKPDDLDLPLSMVITIIDRVMSSR
jgi:hypothetical protein